MRKHIRKLFQLARSLGRDNTGIFNDVYERQLWGQSEESPDAFSSGFGSDLQNSLQYVELVANFIADHKIESVVDIGCGDFRVAEAILSKVPWKVDYTGIDAASVIVERNARLYTSEGIKFIHADATKAPVPSADLVLIREVLQHLSNKDVAAVIESISGKYRFNIITNTVAKNAKKKNVDIPSGSNSRAGLGYGLWLDSPHSTARFESWNGGHMRIDRLNWLA